MNTRLLICLFLCIGGCRQTAPYNFAEHIAPIIHQQCTPCHRVGEAGPFPLVNYHEVKRKAKTIKRVTQSRFMPPWPADPSYRSFIGEKRLTDAQIAMIARWVDDGCPPGDTSRLIYPRFPAGSQLGKPDMVLRFKEPVRIPGDNTDRFMVIKVPYELPQDTFIRTIEYVPGNRALVHHTNGHIVQYDENRKKNVFIPPYYTNRDSFETMDQCFRHINLLHDDGSYPLLTISAFNYLPGMNPLVFPEGIGGFKVKKKGVLLLNDQHYGPSSVDTFDVSTLNVFFMDKPPSRPLLETQLGTLGISAIVPPFNIPANTIKTFYTRAVIKNDISMISVNPHMHLLGKSFKAFAVTTRKDTIPLIHIPRWDFRWQYTYIFKNPLRIPAGSVIWAIGTFDNTTGNPNNPFNPPRDINEKTTSMKTTDEMFQFIFQYLPYEEGDELINLEEGIKK
jgi:hypothetical protein